MARETRTSRDVGVSSGIPNKRKRRGTTPPLPALPFDGPSEPESTGSESTSDQAVKRQKILLKVKPVNVNHTVSGQTSEDAPNAIDPEVRAALAIVISQMAVNLPSPLNGILTLWLPPSFAQKEENTLGYVLRQDDLTWTALVDILHIFAENLLVPCSYPNPMPSLAHFHQPIPPLPAHFRPHVIYNFCSALYTLMLQIEPGQHPKLDAKTVERWALMQKIPSSLNSNTSAGEWFTAAVDPRVAEAGLRNLGKDEETTLLAHYAARGDAFGLAWPVSLQGTGSSAEKRVIKLTDTVVRRASLKMERWKAMRKRDGGFGSVSRGVSAPGTGNTVWTPSFAPTYDSTRTTGAGSYYTQLDAMAERLRYNTWRTGLNEEPDYDEAWRGIGKGAEAEAGVQKALERNAEWIRELHEWQEVRVRKSEAEVKTESREQLIADALLSSLASLAAEVGPTDLLPRQEGPGLAHELSRRFIPVPSPSMRGTLDPRRPQAIHDNLTLRPRSVAQAPNAVSTPLSGQQKRSPFPSTPRSSYPYPQTATAQYSAAQSAYRPPSSTHTPYAAYNPATATMRTTPLPSTPTPTPSAQYVRPGPGPSALRQSFGPLNGIGAGSPYGKNPAAGLMSHTGQNWPSQATGYTRWQ